MRQPSQLLGGVTEVALYSPGEYGWGGKAAVEGDFLYGFMGVDDQQMDGCFEPQLESVLFGRFANELLE